MSYTVAQNTTFLTAASVLQRVISFVYFIVVARFIGAGNLGDYFLALTFTTVFAVVADMGLSPVLTREASRNSDQTQSYFSTVFWSKVVLGLFTYLLVVVCVNIFKYSPEVKILVYVSGITMFFDNVQNAFYSIFRARKNLVYEAVGVVGSQILTLVIGTIALVLHQPLWWLIIAYTVPSFLNTVYAAYFLRKEYNITYRLAWSQALFKQFFLIALPFAIAALLGRLYAYSDSFIMSKLLTRTELGLWSVPYKIIAAFQFIPTALSASVYPVMSSLYISDKARVAQLFEKSYRYLLLIALPTVAGIFAIAPQFIGKFYGLEYINSVPLLHIVIFSLPFSFLGLINGALLNATNHQKLQTYILGLTLGFNVVLNLFLIPRYGLFGAAATAFAGSFVLWFMGHVLASRYTPVRQWYLVKIFFQIALPSLLMAVVVKVSAAFLPLVVVVIIGALLYGLLLFGSGALTLEFVNESLVKIGFKKSLL